MEYDVSVFQRLMNLHLNMGNPPSFVELYQEAVYEMLLGNLERCHGALTAALESAQCPVEVAEVAWLSKNIALSLEGRGFIQ